MKKSFLLSVTIADFLLGGCSSPTNTATTNTTTANTSVATTQSPAPDASPLASTTPVAAGETVTIEEIGIKYSVPAGWKKADDGSLQNEDGSIAIFLIQPPEGDGKEALKNVAAGLDKNLKDIKVEGEAAEHEINGIASYSLTGTGALKDGKKVDWSLELMVAKKPLIVLEVSESGAYEQNKAKFDAFEESFTALEAATPAETPAGDETPEAGETPEASATPAE